MCFGGTMLVHDMAGSAALVLLSLEALHSPSQA